MSEAPEADAVEAATLAGWRRQLAPLRLGSEPIERQLGRKLMALTVMTLVFAGIGSLILGIFALFGRADVGATVAFLVAVLPTAWSWVDFAQLRSRVRSYRLAYPAGGDVEPPPGG